MIPVVVDVYEREGFKVEYIFKLTKQGEGGRAFHTFYYTPSNETEIEDMYKEVRRYLKENGYTAVNKF